MVVTLSRIETLVSKLFLNNCSWYGFFQKIRGTTRSEGVCSYFMFFEPDLYTVFFDQPIYEISIQIGIGELFRKLV